MRTAERTTGSPSHAPGSYFRGTRIRIPGSPSRAGSFEAHFLVLATSFEDDVAKALGPKLGPDGVQVDRNGRTSLERVYAGGALTRGNKTQVATSVGDGAAIALDILSLAKGEPTHDWDVLKAKG